MPPAVARQGRAMQAKKQKVADGQFAQLNFHADADADADGQVSQLNFHAREKAWLGAHLQVRQPSQVLTSHTVADTGADADATGAD